MEIVIDTSAILAVIGEQPEKASTRPMLLVEQSRIQNQGFERGYDIGIARGLASCQRSGIAS